MSDLSKKHIDICRFLRILKGTAPMMTRFMFCEGGCYRLYRMLKVIYPTATAYWDKDERHVLTKIDGVFFDIYGVEGEDVGRKMTLEDHKTAMDFHFDEMRFITDRVPGFFTPEKDI